jgi:hypothetical protein
MIRWLERGVIASAAFVVCAPIAGNGPGAEH